MDNTQKFSGRAEVYQKARPNYAPGLFACLQQEFGLNAGSIAADVGSGTGILTRQLLELGIRVYAVEPNDDMRQIAEKELGGSPGFISVDGSAERTNLPDQSVDFVFAASAFHWFDPLAFKKECERIIKPGGMAFLIWNETQMPEEIKQGRTAIFEKYTRPGEGKRASHKEKPGVKEAFFDGNLGEARFSNAIQYDRERFINRTLSSSYSLTEADPGFDQFVADLGSLFDHYAEGGVIAVQQETAVYYKNEVDIA